MDEKEAKAIIESLIMGKHPKTGADISEDSVLKDMDVIRALYIILKISERNIQSEYNQDSNAGSTDDKLQFHISEMNVSKILSRNNISVTTFIRRINEVVDCPAVQILMPTVFNKWLLNCGYLCEKMDDKGKMRKYPTDDGLEIGLVEDTFNIVGFQAPSIYLSPDAQEYFLKNLGDIISYHINYEIEKKAEKKQALRKRDGQSLPFEINEQQMCEIISEENIGILQFVKKINSVIQNNEMCIPTANEMLVWMESVNILKFVEIEEGKRSREPTELGSTYGIIRKNQVKENGEEYIQTLYTKKAQIFLLNSIPEILEMRK